MTTKRFILTIEHDEQIHIDSNVIIEELSLINAFTIKAQEIYD